MHAFSSLLQSAGLLKTLDLCEDDCLFYTIHDSPYRLMSLAVNLGIEYVAYFLVDMSRVRLLWDPFFLMSEEVETVDQNNRILHLVTKPFQLISFVPATSASTCTTATTRTSMPTSSSSCRRRTTAVPPPAASSAAPCVVSGRG